MNKSVRAKQNWGLMPYANVISSVMPTSVLRGNREVFGSFPGERNFNRFPVWLGKNSTHGKNKRLLRSCTRTAWREAVQSGRRVVARRVRAFAQVAHHEPAQDPRRGREGKGGHPGGDGAHGRVLADAAGLGAVQDVSKFKGTAPLFADPAPAFPPPSSPRSRASATRGQGRALGDPRAGGQEGQEARRGADDDDEEEGDGGSDGEGEARKATGCRRSRSCQREDASRPSASSRRTTARRSPAARARARSRRRRRSRDRGSRRCGIIRAGGVLPGGRRAARFSQRQTHALSPSENENACVASFRDRLSTVRVHFPSCRRGPSVRRRTDTDNAFVLAIDVPGAAAARTPPVTRTRRPCRPPWACLHTTCSSRRAHGVHVPPRRRGARVQRRVPRPRRMGRDVVGRPRASRAFRASPRSPRWRSRPGFVGLPNVGQDPRCSTRSWRNSTAEVRPRPPSPSPESPRPVVPRVAAGPARSSRDETTTRQIRDERNAALARPRVSSPTPTTPLSLPSPPPGCETTRSARSSPNSGIVSRPGRPPPERSPPSAAPPTSSPPPASSSTFAGLVKGAADGAGLGKQVPRQHRRECDAVVHVVRCFDDDDVIHVDGKVDPLADISG